jgi:DNA modification methylase
MSWEVREGDVADRLRELSAESVDAIVTDPPYGTGFMGHAWDQPGDFAPLRANGNPSPFATGRAYPAGHVAGGLQHAIGRSQRRGRQPARSGFDRRASDNGAHEVGRYDFSPAANLRFQAWCNSWATEALRVLRPGGHMVVFGGTRTYHRMVAGVEDAGFEIRDKLAWLFGSGFPKNRKLGDGWGTALKPGHEPILLARKPCQGPVSANFARHGTGGLHIAACGIPLEDPDAYRRNHSGDRGHHGTRSIEDRGATDMRMGGGSAAGARWPANVVLDVEAAELLDEQSGLLISGANPTRRSSDKFGNVYGDLAGERVCTSARGVDVGGASRFYYCAKTSRAERNAGLDGFDPGPLRWSNGDQNPGSFQSDGTSRLSANHHPTVKPIDLMRWLACLVTPSCGVLLDPFAGSGSTGCAAVLEGLSFVGVEREPEYVRIARARIAWWAAYPSGTPTDGALAAAAARPGPEQLGLLD